MQQRVGEVLSFTFTFVYGAEAALKLLAQFPAQYFSSAWNFFEYVIVLVSFAAIGIDFSLQAVLSPTVIRTLRLIRLVRVLRTFRIFNFKALSRLRQLLEVLIHASRSFLAVFGLLAIVYLIFGLFAIPAFGHMCSVYQRDSGAHPLALQQQAGALGRCALVADAALLSKTATFNTLPLALLSLLRINNLDEWSAVLQQLALAPLPRPAGPGAVIAARARLEAFPPHTPSRTKWTRRVPHPVLIGHAASLPQAFLADGAELDLHLARAALPGCQTREELEALGSLVGCEGGVGCDTTCGPPALVAALFCSLFLFLSAYIILNLVLVVLMQRFQEENALLGRKGTVSLSVMLNTSKVLQHWIKDTSTGQHIKSFRARRFTSSHANFE